MGSKQVLIDEELHRRLKAHVASLGISTMKEYVESVIEHAIDTHWPPDEPIPEDKNDATDKTTAKPTKENGPEPQEEKTTKKPSPILNPTPIVSTVDEEDDW